MDFQRFFAYPLSAFRRFTYRRFGYRSTPGHCLSPAHAARFHTRSLCALCQRLERTGEPTARSLQIIERVRGTRVASAA